MLEQIYVIVIDEGEWIDEDNNLRYLANSFYHELFMETAGRHHYPQTRASFPQMDSMEMTKLVDKISPEEVKTALFGMAPWKAPGPDGFPAGFYQKNWQLVGDTVCQFVSRIWSQPGDIELFNNTNICLIPKVERPELITQFRPISLCNVTYKLLTKLVVNKLKPLLPSIISPYQTGFIPTRNIHENIIVAKEMVHSLNRMRGRTGFFAIKVDLMKAYDRLRWSFIAKVLCEIGIPSELAAFIMHCVTSVHTNVVWNGNQSAYFVPERGLRQGDPLSPYLFVMCMDKLTHLIMDEVENGNWIPLRAGRGGPAISHLIFADDLLLFGKADSTHLECILGVLETFCSSAGQLVSQDKTSMFFSKNVDADTRHELLQLSGFRETHNLGRYLGIPLTGRSPRKQDYQYLVENVQAKLSGWKARNLSLAGRITLSKAVIQAIPVYPMMTCLLPVSCLNEIQKLQRGFIWGDKENHRKCHLINWNVLKLPKLEGGLAIRDLSLMNKACIMKLGWALRNNSASLWCSVLRHKYGRNAIDSRALDVKTSDSDLWKALGKVWHFIIQEEAWLIGNGNTASFWFSSWISPGKKLASYVVNPERVIDGPVSDYVTDHGEWNSGCLTALLPIEVVNDILIQSPPAINEDEDLRYWAADPRGQFTISSAYSSLCGVGNNTSIRSWKEVWSLQVAERIKVFMWQLGHNRLLTSSRIAKWSHGDGVCMICKREEETILHALRDCPRVSRMWQHLVPQQLQISFHLAEYHNWFELNISGPTSREEGHDWANIWATACYMVWYWRNRSIHDLEFNWPPHPQSIILNQVDNYVSSMVNIQVQQTHRVWKDIKWQPPEEGYVMLNTDGAFKQGTQIGGCGGCLRGSEGEWLGGFSRNVAVTSAYQAELWGVWEGLQIAQALGVHNLILCVDSVAVVHSLQQNSIAGGSSTRLLQRIRTVMRRPEWKVDVRHVFREANKCADHLANLGCNIRSSLVQFAQPPASVLTWLDHDALGVSTPRLIHL